MRVDVSPLVVSTESRVELLLLNLSNPITVDVPGLAEKRPSVMQGDSILVHKHREPDLDPDTWYEGRVAEVFERRVRVRFSEKFTWTKNDDWDVRFMFNRTVIRRMLLAVHSAFPLNRILFPSPVFAPGLVPPNQTEINRIRPFDMRMASNQPQLTAVAAIVKRPKGSIPFIVFGPYVSQVIFQM